MDALSLTSSRPASSAKGGWSSKICSAGERDIRFNPEFGNPAIDARPDRAHFGRHQRRVAAIPTVADNDNNGTRAEHIRRKMGIKGAKRAADVRTAAPVRHMRRDRI